MSHQKFGNQKIINNQQIQLTCSLFQFFKNFFSQTTQERKCNFSLVARYSLKFTRCSLLVLKSLLTRCKNSLVTRCRSYSLQKVTRYSLQISLVTCCRRCSLQEFTRYSLQNSLVIRCISCSLQKITRYSLQNLRVTRCRSCSFQKFTHCKKLLVAHCKIQSLLIS